MDTSKSSPSRVTSSTPNGSVRGPASSGPGIQLRTAVAGAEGFEAQAAALVPRPDRAVQRKEPAGAAPAVPAPEVAAPEVATPEAARDPKVDAAKQGVPGEVVEGDNVDRLSPIREAMRKQFNELEGKGVGDKEFDAVCSQKTWDEMKAKEAKAKAEAEVKYAKDFALWKLGGMTGPKPVKDYVPIYTTCIDTMRVVSQLAWKSSGLAVKRLPGKGFDMFSFGAASRDEGKKLGAWVDSKPNAGKTPKMGDMLMLEKAGATFDKLQEEGKSNDWTLGAKVDKLKKELDKLEAATASLDEAKAAANAAKAKDVEAKLAEARTQYEAAKTAIKTKHAEAAAKLAQRVDGGAKLEFSHVGFFKSATDEIVDGKKTGRQIWETFDGGQSGIGKNNQGAKSSKRYYDPKTNMIGGEATQGGANRWLAGWIDLDSMVAGKKEDKPAQ